MKNAPPPSSTRRKRDSVIVDPVKLQWHIDRTARSISQFAIEFGISRKSIYRMRDRVPVQRSTVSLLAEQLDVRCEDLLESTPVITSPEEATSPWVHPEWEVIIGSQILQRTMSNGLVMQVAKVRHRILPNEFGRAKVYDIAGMPAAVRNECREMLSRHAEVARRLGHSSRIATNLTLTVQRQGSLWTSVDRWFEHHTVAEEIRTGPVALMRSIEIVSDVASACSELHQHNIILRELHPLHVLVRKDTRRCVVTDLELAKLLSVEATVSSQWQPNPYRAPEVAGGESRVQADLYSCARLFVHLLTGVLPDYPQDRDSVTANLSESNVAAFLGDCLSPNWKKRPDSMAELRLCLEEMK